MKHAFYMGGTRGLSAVFGVLQLSLTARFLPAEQFALVSAALALSAYFLLAAEPAVLGYQRLGHHDHDRDNEPDGPRVASRSILGAVSILVVLMTVVFSVISGQWLQALSVCLWVLSLVQMRWASIQFLNWDQQVRFGTLMVVNSAARTVMLGAGAWVFREAAPAMILGALGSFVATTILSPRAAGWSFSRSSWLRVLSIGIPLSVVAVGATSLTNLPILVGARLISADQFASYAAQWGLAASAYGATAGFLIVLGFPQAKKAWDTGEFALARTITKRYHTYANLVSALIILGFLVAGELVTGLLLGPAYAGVLIPVASIAAWSLRSLTTLASWRYQFEYRQVVLAGIALLAAAVQVPIVIVSTSTFGLVGLMISIGAVNAMYASAVILLSRSDLRRMMLLTAAVLIAIEVCAALAVS